MVTTTDIDWRLFFTGPRGVRANLFDNRLTQQQVDGMNRVCKMAIDEFELPLAHVAYILATAYHETGRRMHPVRETFARSDSLAIARLEKAFAAGKMKWVRRPYWRSGYFGRGEVQLTWLTNYRKMNRVIRDRFPGVDIVDNPSAILEQPEISSYIMIYGMVHGSFTGKKLSDYGDGDPRFDHEGARAIINPHEYDSYGRVGGYSVKFLAALERAVR